LPTLILLRRTSSSSRVEENSTSSGEGLPQVAPPIQSQLEEYSHTVNPKQKHSSCDASQDEYTHQYLNHNTFTGEISSTYETETEESNVSTDISPSFSYSITQPENISHLVITAQLESNNETSH